MLFDGSNDRITRTGVSPSSLLNVSAWVRPLSLGKSNNGTIFSFSGAPNLSYVASTQLRFGWFYTGDDGSWQLTPVLTLGVWWHVFVNYQTGVGNAPNFYLNGALQAKTTISAPSGSPGNNSGLLVGAHNVGGEWHGDIGPFAMWTGRLLTADEVALIYARGPFASPSALYLYWRMDEGIGSVMRDYSENGRDGTISGALAGEGAPAPTAPVGAVVAA